MKHAGMVVDDFDDSACAARFEAAWVHAEPKRPPSAYFLYMEDAKSKIDGEIDAAAIQKIQSGWKHLDAQIRETHESEASKLQAVYDEQRFDYLEYGRYKVQARSAANAAPFEARVPVVATQEDLHSAHSEEEVTEFSHEQFHHVVDMAVKYRSEKAGLPDGLFSDVATRVKQAFPCASGFEGGQPIFSRAQVRQLLEVIAQKCSESLAESGSDRE